MITANENVINEIISPVRDIHARVELYEGSTLIETCNCHDRLIKFTIERIGDESKFFGFGICQRLNVHLIDQEGTLNISTANSIKVAYRIGENELVYPYPTFRVSEVRRDENTNELSVTAYDLMYPDSAHLIPDMHLPESYSILYFASAAVNALGATALRIDDNVRETSNFMINMPQGGNFTGNETVREGLNDVAEVTQTIYYIDNQDRLVFKRLSQFDEPNLVIGKEDYITLQTRTNKRLGKIYHTTELNDNIYVETTEAGSTQYIRDNAFFAIMEPTQIKTALDIGIIQVGGLTINQFDCSWRGNFLLEIGDKIALTQKNDQVVYAYIIDDVVEYGGYFTENTRWAYNSNDAETEAAPTTLGEALNQTFARVDKVNHEIELLASKIENTDVSVLEKEVASLKVTTDSITQQVTKVETTAANNESAIETLTNKVTNAVTANDVSILIEQELGDGITSITTETGYVFNKDGLTISKSGSEMETQITEDGMTVYRNNTAMLTANSAGVDAVNLHATTYLIIGTTSRFEDFEDPELGKRTGCFWIDNM